MTTDNTARRSPRAPSDRIWIIVWCTSVLIAGVWDFMFLNRPALVKVVSGFVNTMMIASLSVLCTLCASWVVTLLLHHFESRKNRAVFYLLTFSLNLIRSVPQIVGILFAYIGIAALLTAGIITSKLVIIPLLACSMSLFIMPEVTDLLRDRIQHYARLDFFNAMRVCGISEWRIINFDIFWKNSKLHILNKLIAVFGSAIFLQCSVDFIISVGLSTSVNAVTLPVTLGSLLAKMDSKQDILAIGNTLTNPAYFPNLFTEHLQGITVAFLIVITILSVFRISNGYAERNRL